MESMNQILYIKDDLDFSRENTEWIRGLTALALVLIHILENYYIGESVLLRIAAQSGVLCVAIYFFLSGYGLITSMKYKNNYLKGFLFKRFVRLLVPVYIAECFYLLVNILLEGTIKVKEIYELLFFWEYVSFSWFVLSIGVVYIMFYLSFSRFKRYKHGLVCFLFFLGGGYILCFFAGINEIYYKCIPAVILGALYGEYYFFINKYFRKYYAFIILIIFFLLLLSRNMSPLGKNGIFSIAMCLVLILLCLKFTIRSKVTQFLSNNSYELYIIHGLIIKIYENLNISFHMIHTVIIIIIAVCSATILRYIGQKVILLLNSAQMSLKGVNLFL